MKRLFGLSATAVLALATPTFAQTSGAGGNPATPSAGAQTTDQSESGRVTSGPGVQGAPDTRTGPSTRSPDDAQGSSSSGAASGASTGASGSASPTAPPGQTNSTQPSQDSSGVQGPADTRTGPSTRSPGEGEGNSPGPSKQNQ